MKKRNWYAAKTGNHQGLVIDESTGENIAVTYKAENAEIVAAAPELFEELVKAESALFYADTEGEFDTAATKQDIHAALISVRALLEKLKDC